jgi:PAS domain S-box-containing protein
MLEKFKAGKILDMDKNIIEGKGLKKDGQEFPADFSSYILEFDGEQIATTILRDVTERKQAEEKLRDSEERARALLNIPPDIALLMDNKGNILDCNETFIKRFNKSTDELLGSCCFDLFTPELAKSRKEHLDNVIQAGKPVRFQDKRQGRWFDGVLHPIFDKNGKVTSTAVLARDVTEIKQAEEKLIEYQNKLRSMASQLTLTEEMERRHFADYLHDQIGQKLFALNLKLETLRNATSADTTAAALDESFNIVKQVIKDARSLTFEISPPLLYQLGLEAALEWLTEETHKQYSIRVTFEDDKQEKPIDDDTKILLFRAVRELLTNIAKHAQTQKAKVSIRRDNTNMRVCVEDDGVGFIPSETIFGKSKSTGFGLFSVKERLEQLGGNLEIESILGRGTQITLVAPLKSKKSQE